MTKRKCFYAFNSSLVTLIPKSNNAKMIKDYWHISCCTNVYKIIAKTLSSRLGKVLKNIIHHSQVAFVPDQHLQDHVLLAYELIKGYSTKYGPPRCIIQIDLQKAYDSIKWNELEIIMQELSFPPKFITWILLTVKNVAYSYCINGDHTRRLKARKGLRQRDPFSPLHFVIIMEYLYRTFGKLANNPNFNYHSRCDKLGIVPLFLLMFSLCLLEEI